MSIEECISYRRVVEEYFRVVDAEEFSRLSEIFHQDIIYERPGYLPIVGLHDLTTFYVSQRILTSGKHLLDEIVIEHNSGACWGRYIGKTKDGRFVNERFADVYTFKENRIVRRITFFFMDSIFL